MILLIDWDKNTGPNKLWSIAQNILKQQQFPFWSTSDVQSIWQLPPMQVEIGNFFEPTAHCENSLHLLYLR